jgi:hypothetical protein
MIAATNAAFTFPMEDIPAREPLSIVNQAAAGCSAGNHEHEIGFPSMSQ